MEGLQRELASRQDEISAGENCNQYGRKIRQELGQLRHETRLKRRMEMERIDEVISELGGKKKYQSSKLM